MNQSEVEYFALDDFEPIEKNKILGEGAFSEVTAVQHKKTH